jgi:predicted dinucleotide-binding enzyme
MDVAVIGAGTIGLTLARAWRDAGLTVTVAVRDPDADRHAALRAELAVAAVADAVPAARATLLAVPGAGLPELVSASSDVLDGRLLLDATNLLGAASLHQVPLLRGALPTARVYRAFNTVGWETFADPTYVVAGHPVAADLLYCGPDGGDVATVEELVRAVGLNPVRLGGLDAADVLDGVARLWFTLAFGRGLGREIAFTVLTARP